MENQVINLGNRIIDTDGNVVYCIDALIELLYNGEIPSEILFPYNNEDVLLFNKFSYENFDDILYKLPEKLLTTKERQNDWFFPDYYKEINLEDYFLNLCQTDIEKQRVIEETKLYNEKGFDNFLRFCIFFSDKIKENNWVIGVGRGSSCESYLLYLLKIHLVDSIKYNLDIKEFLK